MHSPLFSSQKHLILASASPRRQRFLRDLGIDFTVSKTDIEETPLPDEQPDKFAVRMAAAKAAAAASHSPRSWVLGADTVVTLPDGTILGKPANESAALDMLNTLNNATHRVMTALCLNCQEKDVCEQLLETTEVTLMDSPEEVLRAYVRTGEPMDKAGAYGIQGKGSLLVRSIRGSYTNVVGLPVDRLVTLLLRHGIIRAVPSAS